ncbi:MAG TPA: hypothetical protein PLP61_12250 [Nocardioides sp.]|uniref:hypothetical protein n=1 Tax=Nocardioides sp. TaxID=35761 RepID=UPI002B8B9018|nr:hypothetical protein [Nocardioides sp.]HQR27800.1 hypothetical protein [Nocardioides sp.]
MSTFLVSPAGATDVHAAASDAGDLAVVWERGGAVEMAYSPADVGFGTRVVVSAADSSDPRAAYDASGRLLVVWTSAKGGEPPRLMSRVMTDTGTWAAPVQIATRPGGTIRVADVAVNASGQAVVGWLWRDRALVTRGALGGSWSTGAPWRKTLSVDVAIGDGGHAAAMLQGWVGPLADEATLTFAVARQSPAGVWGATKILQTVVQDPPWVGPGGVAVDAQGVTTVAWQRFSGTGTTVVARRARPGRAFGAPVVLAGQPTRSESPVRVLATPDGLVQVAWVHDWIAGVRAVRRPVGGPWSAPAVVCGGDGVVVGWDVALADTGQGLAAVSRAAHFGTQGTRTSVTNRAGRWLTPDQVSTIADGPQVAISTNWAVVTWLTPKGVRVTVNE